MSDDRIEEALRSVGDDYIRRNPADLFEARTKVGRLRRRRQFRAVATTALGATAALAVAVLAWPGPAAVRDRPRPAGPADLPSGAITIPVGDVPTEVAVGEGAVWVSSSADSTVSRIDPATNVATVAARLAGAPGDLAVGDGGEVWVANPALGAVQRIDPVTETTTPDLRVDVAPADSPLDLAIDRYLWVSVVDEELVQVDTATGEIVRRIDSVRPVNVAARDGGVFVLDANGTVRGIDPLTGEPNAIELSFDVEGRGDVHFYDGKVWVAEGDGQTLYSAGVTSGSKGISSYSFRGTYMEMVLASGGILVLSDLGDGTAALSLIDTATGRVTEVAEIPGSPRDLVRGLDDLWISLSGTGEVLRIPALP